MPEPIHCVHILVRVIKGVAETEMGMEMELEMEMVGEVMPKHKIANVLTKAMLPLII